MLVASRRVVDMRGMVGRFRWRFWGRGRIGWFECDVECESV
jgi:hypothetical protein